MSNTHSFPLSQEPGSVEITPTVEGTLDGLTLTRPGGKRVFVSQSVLYELHEYASNYHSAMGAVEILGYMRVEGE